MLYDNKAIGWIRTILTYEYTDGLLYCIIDIFSMNGNKDSCIQTRMPDCVGVELYQVLEFCLNQKILKTQTL